MSLPNPISVETREPKLQLRYSRSAVEASTAPAVAPDVSDLDSDITGVDAAFQLFNRVTGELVQSYEALEGRVSHLTDELSQALERGKHELAEKERLAHRLSSLLSLLPAGVVVLDGQGIVQQCNPAAIELLGEPLEGQRWFDIIQRSFAPRADDGHEVSLRDGRRVSISTRSMEGEPGQLVVLHDLTETRELQAQVSRNERLSSMGRMVASLAHQIRTPLSAAMLYAGHLAQPDLGPALRVKCAQKLMSRLTHLDQQVRDMLIFAKGETRLAESMRLSDLLREVQSASEATVQNARAVCEWVDASAGTQVLCNREALVGALLNLIQNSIEACKGPVRIRIQASAAARGFVSLVIQDNGAGFDREKQARIMDAFYTTKPQGTGLGLAVVQAVVKAHRGHFFLTSPGVDQGARAVITLPVFAATSASGQHS